MVTDPSWLLGSETGVAGRFLTEGLKSGDTARNDGSSSKITLALEGLLKDDKDMSTNAATALILAGL
jgi:hypothetical protein